MSEPGRWPGTWRVICDVCGFEFPSDQVKKRWDGLIVCDKDYEQKHPQLSIRTRPEKMGVAFARPESTDVFINVCTLVTSSGYTGLGTAGCMRAGNTQYTYTFLNDIDGGGT